MPLLADIDARGEKIAGIYRLETAEEKLSEKGMD
jgi:hypothetical protein